MSESVPKVSEAFLPTTKIEFSPDSDCSSTEIGSSNGSLSVGGRVSIAVHSSLHTGTLRMTLLLASSACLEIARD